MRPWRKRWGIAGWWWDDCGGKSGDSASVAEFGDGGGGVTERNGEREGGAAVWVGEVGIVERESEPLPLGVADTDAGGTPVDEFGAGGGGVLV